jgi:hypothetical protein
VAFGLGFEHAEHALVDRWHRAEVRDPLLLDRVEQELGLEVRLQHERRPAVEGG